MQQFQTNYTAKHGTKIPPPKLYMDEGDSEEEGLELNDGTVYGGKAPSDPKPKPPGTGGAGRGAGRGSAPEVQVEAQVEGLGQVALEVQARGAGKGAGKVQEQADQVDQVDQGEEVPVAVVVAADQGEVEETLQKTPTEVQSVAVKMMMMTKMIRTRSSKQILREGGAHDKNKANLVVADLARVASSQG